MSIKLQPEISNELGQQQWDYIINTVGLDTALAALAKLNTQNRRLFPLNVAKLLRISMPQSLLTRQKKNKRTRDVPVQEMLRDQSWAFFE